MRVNRSQRRESAAVNVGGWWNNTKFVQPVPGTQVWEERDIICVSNVPVMESHSWPLSPARLPLSQLLVLALKVSSEFRRTMKTISTGLLPLPPDTTSGETGCYGLDIREELKGCCGYLSSPKKHFNVCAQKLYRLWDIHYSKPQAENGCFLILWWKTPGVDILITRPHRASHFCSYCSTSSVFCSAFITFQLQLL